jgi:hypothetical protein
VIALLLLAILAADQEPAPAMPPAPRTVPVVPVVLHDATADPADRLIEQLEQTARTRDQAIDQLVAGPMAEQPRAIDAKAPGAVDALRDQSRARAELAAALSAWEARTPRRAGDVLDRGTPRAMAAQVAPLEARNRLAIAECCRDLLGTADGGEADLQTGEQALATIDPARLDDADLPRLYYLRLWFQLERARRETDPTRKAKLIEQARTTQAELGNRFADSPLARLSPELFAGLEPTP